MPELPDLIYLRMYLQKHLLGRTVGDVLVRKPVVLRVATDEPFRTAVAGKTITGVTTRGPFLCLSFDGALELILNLMLAGKLQHQQASEKPQGHLCFSLLLDDGARLNLCDEQSMAKAYLVRNEAYGIIPKFETQGVDILSAEFTLQRLQSLVARHGRKQVRVFLNDQKILSAIGNAYADEILFEAGIHPKTFAGTLSQKQVEFLFEAIRSVMAWGTRAVQAAGQPIHVKVRDHLKVRNRKGELCPRCGSTIRREGVRGHDVYFCPECQPASRKLFLDWRRTTPGRGTPDR